MIYRSLNGHYKKVNFETALKKGLAEDGGLFFPEKIKPLKSNFTFYWLWIDLPYK